jgi:predicted RNA-binding Zn ribbon-like protein
MRDWYWLGAPLAMDFANTTHRRGFAGDARPRGGADLEMLREPADLAEWVHAQRDDSVPRVDAWAAAAGAGTTLADVRALRDDVQRLLHAVADGRPHPADAVERINSAARAVPLVPQLRGGRAVMEPAVEAPAIDELLARVAVSAIEIAGGACAVAFCDAPSCGGFFEPARTNQVWCSDACGTRARVARHAARH